MEMIKNNNLFLMILLFSCTISTIVLLNSTEAKILDFKLEVNSIVVHSDITLTINGASSPAPTLFAQTNDTLILQVNNCLPNVTHHPNLITIEGKIGKREILPGETVICQFIAHFPGTYMYRIYLANDQKEAIPAYGLILVADDDKLPLPPAAIKLEIEDGGLMAPTPLHHPIPSPKQFNLLKPIVVIIMVIFMMLSSCLIRMFFTRERLDGPVRPTVEPRPIELTIFRNSFSVFG